MRKLLNLYGNAMVSIGIWFFNRGEKYAPQIELPELPICLCKGLTHE